MRTTRCIDLGGVSIGGGSPVSIQSMTNLPWHDVDGTLAQIDRLAALGCQIIRVAVPSHDSLSSLAAICSSSKLPVVADIHFDHRLAIGAM
jgi:(E)-4-hydroxy-3-methylbut-2-enyl-diphosphate synthase